VLTLLVLTSLTTSLLAQEVSIPVPGLNAAIREALQKPAGPLTQQDLLTLTNLDASTRNISNPQGLEAARNLVSLSLQTNHLTNFSLPNTLTNLTVLDLSVNSLTNCSFPDGLIKLATLNLKGNLLTNLTLPAGPSLSILYLDQNQLTSLTLSAGLGSLTFLQLAGNQLTSLTLPPDIRRLTSLFLDGNPLLALVVSEPLAARDLAGAVTSLQNQGFSVFTYPLAVSLASPRQTAVEKFELTLHGPPGIYSVQSSADLTAWSELGALTNKLGSVVFTDATFGLSERRFYRALQ